MHTPLQVNKPQVTMSKMYFSHYRYYMEHISNFLEKQITPKLISIFCKMQTDISHKVSFLEAVMEILSVYIINHPLFMLIRYV